VSRAGKKKKKKEKIMGWVGEKIGDKISRLEDSLLEYLQKY
jgi:hypothetical protein